MSLEVFTFWGLSAVLVGSALAVVLSRNLFHSVLWLALALTGTAGVFLALHAEFLAAVQVLLYAGGVVTVVVFAIVVTERLVGERLSHTSRRLLPGVFASAVLLWALGSAIVAGTAPDAVGVAAPAGTDLTTRLGEAMLTTFVLPFELLAVLLLVSLVAASYLARPEE